jgi:hypothetical protein
MIACMWRSRNVTVTRRRRKFTSLEATSALSRLS